MKIRNLLAAAALSAGLVAVNPAVAAAADPSAPAFGFSTLKPVAPDAAKAKCVAWLQSVGKYNQTAVDEIWARENVPVVDRVADTLALADPEVAASLAAARNPDAAARLAAARAAVATVSEQWNIPVENLLLPDLLRRLCWSPPADGDVLGYLRAGGARPWQIGLLGELLEKAADAKAS